MAPTAAQTCPECGLDVPPGELFCPRDGTDLSGEDSITREPTVRKDSLENAKLGEYVIRKRIGSGGMGIVYEGEQPLIGKRVAVKVLRAEFAEDPVQMQRLLAEARAVNAIRHRGIIDIFGFGETPDGRQYIVMEYLAGQPLDLILSERGSLPTSEVLPLLDEIVSALAAAHGAGVIHRDLKPSNIFVVTQPDGSRYLKLLDFGLAKNTANPGDKTRSTQVVGTPEYMAPEQTRQGLLSPATDLYALGVCAYELLTGRIPFDGPTPIDIAMKHLEQPPPPPSRYDASIPDSLEKLILHLLAKAPEDRPESAEAVRSELKRIQRELLQAATRIQPALKEDDATVPAREAVEPTRVRPRVASPRSVPPRGRPTPPPAGGGVAALVLLGLAIAFVNARRPLPAEIPRPGPPPVQLEPAAEAPARRPPPEPPAPALASVEPKPAPTAPVAKPVATAKPAPEPVPAPEASASATNLVRKFSGDHTVTKDSLRRRINELDERLSQRREGEGSGSVDLAHADLMRYMDRVTAAKLGDEHDLNDVSARLDALQRQYLPEIEKKPVHRGR